MEIVLIGGQRSSGGHKLVFRALMRMKIPVYNINLTYYYKTAIDEKISKLEDDLSFFEDVMINRVMKEFMKEEINQLILVFSMHDLFEEALIRHPLVDFYPEFDSSKQSELEFIIELYLSKIGTYQRNQFSVFVKSGFDSERTEFFFELLQRKMDGEILDQYYPYKQSPNLKLPNNLKDITLKIE